MLVNFAKYISYIFEPFTVSFLTLLIVVSSLDMSLINKLQWLALAVVMMGLPPIVVYLYEKTTGKIKDWFMTNRAERKDVQFAWFFGAASFSLLAWYLEAPRLLLALGLTLLCLSLLITLVNFYWKISVHMMGVSLFVMIAIFVYSLALSWLVFLIFLVGWARIKLGAHTFLQVSFGAILTIVVFYTVFGIFGLVTF